VYPAVGVAGAAACEKRPVSSLTGAAVDAAILALTAFRGLGSFLTPRIGQADTIAVLEQPALADGERKSLSCHGVEAARKHPPSGLAIGRVVQRSYQKPSGSFSRVRHTVATPSGTTSCRLEKGNHQIADRAGFRLVQRLGLWLEVLGDSWLDETPSELAF